MPGLLTNNLYDTLITAIIIYLITYKLVNYLKFIKTNIKLVGDQQLHIKQTPRTGGLILFLSVFFLFLFLNFFHSFQLQFELFLFIFLIFALGFLEDVFQNIPANLRFILLMIISLTSAAFFNLPDTKILLLDELISSEYLKIFFYGLCIMLLINGNNMIDGLNGLCILNNLCTLSGIIIISFIVNDINYFNLSFSIFILLATALLFNFPNAKIFLGDSGAYLIGFLNSFLIINIFYDYKELNPLIIWILLAYPISEVLFSFLRKILKKKSPLYPDKYHTHIKLFNLNKEKFGPLNANPISTLMLSILWFTPLIFFLIAIINQKLIIILIIIYSLIYLMMNLLIPNFSSDNKNKAKME